MHAVENTTMTRLALAAGLIARLLAELSCAIAAESPAVWRNNAPLVRVDKQLYLPHPRSGVAALAAVTSIGPAGERAEVQAVEFRDDVHNERRRRISSDDGQTWGQFETIASTDVVYQGHEVTECGGLALFDATSGLLVEPWLRQIPVAGVYHCFSYIRTSADFGRTWSSPVQLRYEPGPDFDPERPLAPEFLHRNEGYIGNNLARCRDGTLVICLAHANAPGDPQNDRRPWRMGSLCFQGRWNAERREYQWRPGQRVEISPSRSARGLMEPETAELSDGRLLVVWRGSTTGWDGTKTTTPGRKFYSLSNDRGLTLSEPAEWSYDDGSSFYSPSSIHRLIRHTRTGKLYWLGNITADPPQGNSPRYPLVIAEVDETHAALRRDTVTSIDDRQPDQPAEMQLSNFSLLEDRRTGNLELYLTIYGERPENVFTADCYRYTLQFLR